MCERQETIGYEMMAVLQSISGRRVLLPQGWSIHCLTALASMRAP